MLIALLSEFGGYIVGGIAALAAIFTVYFKGRSAGIKEERVEQRAEVQKQADVAAEKVQNVEDKITAATDAAVLERARSKWVRR